MMTLSEAEKAIEYHTKIKIARMITALTIYDRDEDAIKSSQAQMDIPKLYNALIEMYHEINRHGSKLGGLTPEEILQFALDYTNTVRKYPDAYGPAMRYLYPF